MKMKSTLPILILIFLTSFGHSNAQTNEGGNETEQNQKSVSENSGAPTQISTFLTFQENNAEEAMNFYVSLFDNSEILDIQRHGKGGPAKEGSILWATFTLNGKSFMCSDSYVKHAWDFNPAVSNFVECKNEEELLKLFFNTNTLFFLKLLWEKYYQPQRGFNSVGRV